MTERNLEKDIKGITGYIDHLGTPVERRDHNEVMGVVLSSEILQDEVVQAIGMAIRKARWEGVILGIKHANGQDVMIEGEGVGGTRRRLSSIIDEELNRQWVQSLAGGAGRFRGE